MKVTKTITIDVEVAVELAKIKNSSALINAYLRSYFEIPKYNEEEELKQKAEESKIIAAIFQSKVDAIEENKPQAIERPDL